MRIKLPSFNGKPTKAYVYLLFDPFFSTFFKYQVLKYFWLAIKTMKQEMSVDENKKKLHKINESFVCFVTE